MKLPKRILIAVFCITLISGSDAFAIRVLQNTTEMNSSVQAIASGHERSRDVSLSSSLRHRSITHLHQSALRGEFTDVNDSQHTSINTGGRSASSAKSLAPSDTSMMLLAGIGLIVLQLRRKQKSLHQRPLVSL